MSLGTAKEAIARWIARDNEVYELLLRKCDFDLKDTQLVIACPAEIIDIILDTSHHLSQPFHNSSLRSVVLTCDDEAYQFPINLPSRYMKDLNIPIIWQIPDSGAAIAVVRMCDHKGIFCTTQVEQHCKTPANDWTGEDMSRWWIDDNLRRFADNLQTHGHVTDYVYRALRMADNEPIELTVNAWLTQWRGEWVRVVQNLQTIPT